MNPIPVSRQTALLLAALMLSVAAPSTAAAARVHKAHAAQAPAADALRNNTEPAHAAAHDEAAKVAGHWEGSIKAPSTNVGIQVDLVADRNGTLAGTFGNPAQHLEGFPLSQVAAEGNSIHFRIEGAMGGTFEGTLGDDGKSMAGDFKMATPEGDMAFPFELTRTGDAHIEASAPSAPIGKELEGSWSGTLEAEGKPMRVVLKLTNRPDGTSGGSIANLDQGGVEIAASSIEQQAASVKVDVKIVAGSYSGVLNAEHTELAGTWTQGGAVLPLTLRRAADAGVTSADKSNPTCVPRGK